MNFFVYLMLFMTFSDAAMGDWIAGEFYHDRFDWLEVTIWLVATVVLQRLDKMGAK
ncbi:hypothetical protein OTAKU_00380 [Serratia phage vB_SmaM-Otaku]|uniref:Uncharacterized protein n=1 Tax=Serratia phage vB_SmaM-Otaku TaxID=2932867 RepID=A0AAE9HFX8_9CAUD|nr:hypothetical protein PF631_gp38 [Serratia phage vB_SmaM-Otaku]UPU16027.1 hypothetical protein OTAKU_00380 [Serratia phage vB_SmaM-Otaku]